MRQIIALLLSIAVLAALCACGRSKEKTELPQTPPDKDAVPEPEQAPAAPTPVGEAVHDLWAEASPSTSALSLLSFDGTQGHSGLLFEQEKVEAVLARLGAVDAVPVEGWSPALLTYPVYALEIGSRDGASLRMAWSNGYLITKTGDVYIFDYDLSALELGYGWRQGGRTPDAPADLPCGRYLVQDAGGWYPQHMHPAAQLTPPAEVSMTLEQQMPGALTVRLQNEGGGTWCYGRYFSIQVLLDGAWYDVPTRPEENWGFPDLALLLPPGEARTETYKTLMYGSLPAGQYRLVVEGLTAEFRIE